MKFNSKIVIIITLAVIILSNIYPFTQILKISIDERHYRFSNYNGSFTFYEFMDRNFVMMKRNHKNCLSKRPELKDKNIYRLYSKNPLAFWRWRLYFFDVRYKLPYKNWDDIKKIRAEENVKRITGCTIDF